MIARLTIILRLDMPPTECNHETVMPWRRYFHNKNGNGRPDCSKAKNSFNLILTVYFYLIQPDIEDGDSNAAMSDTNLFRRYAEAQWPDGGEKAKPPSPPILVVSSSPVNRIVIARIAEGVNLRTISEDPVSAIRTLNTRRPATVIIDAGTSNEEWQDFLDAYSAYRQECQDKKSPILIALSHASPSVRDKSSLVALADATVMKPITPEGLQPLLLQLTEKA